MFNVVSVKFQKDFERSFESKEYAYLTDMTDLEEGDLVVVDTQYGYKTAKVTSLFGNEMSANKWIVCVIDTEAFEGKLADLKHKQFILKQIKQRVERSSFIVQAQAIAKTDPTLAKLLSALESKTRISGPVETPESSTPFDTEG